MNYIIKKYAEKYSKNRILRPFLRPLYRMYENYSKDKRQHSFLENADSVLLKFAEAMDEQKIDFWLTYGTLLGAIREKDFIPHDLDIDVGVWLSDYSINLENKLFDAGFKKLKQYSIDNKKLGFEQTYIYKNVTIDVFYFLKDKNKMWTYWFTNPVGLSHHQAIKKNGGLTANKSIYTLTKFKKIEFLNRFYLAPENFNRYLIEQYGESYLVPNPNWDVKTMGTDEKTNDVGVYEFYG